MTLMMMLMIMRTMLMTMLIMMLMMMKENKCDLPRRHQAMLMMMLMIMRMTLMSILILMLMMMNLARRHQAMSFPQLETGHWCLEVATMAEHSL